MPVYPATLQLIPAPMQESVILTFGRQLRTSLQSVHHKDYSHNDVKAANVFISATGEQYPNHVICMLPAVSAMSDMYPSSVYTQVSEYLRTLGLL